MLLLLTCSCGTESAEQKPHEIIRIHSFPLFSPYLFKLKFIVQCFYNYNFIHCDFLQASALQPVQQ